MPKRITVDVYEADGTTHVRTLDEDDGRQWLDDLHDVGFWQVRVPVDSDDEAALTDGRIVKFSLDGTERFAGLIEKSGKTQASRGRAGERRVTVSGRGALALLDRAIVYPELELGRYSPQVRHMSFAAADFDDSGWPTAVPLKQQSASATPWSGAPAGWPDPAAYWIGVTGDATPGVAAGERFARRSFTMPSADAGDCFVSVAADDAWQLYIDGDLVRQEDTVGMWGQTTQFTYPFDTGAHTLAVRWENLDRPASPSTNVTGFILSIAPVVFGNVPGTPVVRTDGNWKVDNGAAGVPGMFVGDTMDVFLEEAQARGCFPELNWDFTGLVDSNGDSWINTLDVAFTVGARYLEVAKHFDAEGAAVFWITPDLTLHAAAARGDDKGATPGTGLSTVELEYSVNLGRLAHSRTGPGANTALGLSVYGRWFEAEDTAAQTAWGRRETSLSLGSAPSLAAVVRQTDALFDDQANPIEALTDVQVEEVTGALPFTDWDVGDTVSLTGYDGTLADHLIVALAVTEDAAGNPFFHPEAVPV